MRADAAAAPVFAAFQPQEWSAEVAPTAIDSSIAGKFQPDEWTLNGGNAPANPDESMMGERFR